jgi:uncharacterized protein (DUF1330 family)
MGAWGLEKVSAYIIADLEVKDPVKFREYAERVPKTIEQYGGRYLVRAGRFEVWEGDWKPKSLVILEFPSWDAAQKWYDSEEYRPLKEMRTQSAPTNGVIVEGVSHQP